MWKSYLIAQDGMRWSEAGNITFSAGNAVQFESNGMSGYQAGNYADLQYGSVSRLDSILHCSEI